MYYLFWEDFEFRQGKKFWVYIITGSKKNPRIKVTIFYAGFYEYFSYIVLQTNLNFYKVWTSEGIL